MTAPQHTHTQVLSRVPKGQSVNLGRSSGERSPAALTEAAAARSALAPPPAPQAEDVQNGAALGHRVGWLNCQRLYQRAEITASLGTPGAPLSEGTGSEGSVEPWV